MNHFRKVKLRMLIDIMAHNKAPGPDGIPVEFYQVCWPIIKQVTMKLFHDLSNGDLDLYRLNFGMIILLQKS
jgi:hypothetical protein